MEVPGRGLQLVAHVDLGDQDARADFDVADAEEFHQPAREVGRPFEALGDLLVVLLVEIRQLEIGQLDRHVRQRTRGPRFGGRRVRRFWLLPDPRSTTWVPNSPTRLVRARGRSVGSSSRRR